MNRKRKWLEILLLAATIIGVLCAVVVGFLYWQNNQKNKYVNEQYGFEVKYPEGWTVSEGSFNTVVMFYSPKDGPLDAFKDNFSIVIQDLSRDPMSLKAYSEKAILQTKVVFKEQIDVVESVNTRVAGEPAHKFVFIGKSDAFDLQMMIVWFIQDFKAYQFTYTSTANEFDSFLPEAEAIINSFKLK